ncbi:MAG: hypothetical protein CBARDMAM_3254 [uncultured Caballeronia sp.]|nr:MAG: hypothetical protein CBARDMAM_3254 [uncultured Caballeronia sp.]
MVNIPVDTRSLPQNAGKADGSLLPAGALLRHRRLRWRRVIAAAMVSLMRISRSETPATA